MTLLRLFTLMYTLSVFGDGVVAVTVTNWPRFVQKPENIPIGTSIVNITVIEQGVTIVPNDGETSSIASVTQAGDGHTFNVKLKTLLDREVKSRYILTFKITDNSGGFDTRSLSLYATDVNDNYPQFQGIPYFWEINETPGETQTSCKPKCSTFNVITYDPDEGQNGRISYSMVPVTQSVDRAKEYNSTFSINETSGIVTMLQTVDYEQNSYYQFTIFAMDHGTPALTSNTSLVIQIKDLQDRPPFYTGIPYRATLEENLPANHSVVAVYAQDGDPGISNNVNYTILQGPCTPFFTIDTNNGRITTIGSLDRDSGAIKEVSGVCTLTVLAKEIEGNHTQYGNTTTVTNVTVIITDLDDNKPTFNAANYAASVQENAPEDIPISIDSGTIVAFDNDTGINAQFTLTLHYDDGTKCSDFEPWPDHVEGEQSVMIRVKNRDILDYEQRHNITLKLIATETQNTTATSETTIFLKLLDVNDNNPQFSNTSYSITIPENSQNFIQITTITATDRDSDQNLTYSLSGAGNSFWVNNNTGEIFTRCQRCTETFDRERRDVFYLTYVVTDPGGRSDSAPLEIRLSDVNDNTPMFDRNYSASIKENDRKYIKTPIVTFSASDNDLENTNNSLVTYTIVSISQPGLDINVTLDDTTGELFLTAPIDYEALTESQVDIIVNATDHGTPALSSLAWLTIDVQDENDNVPEFYGYPFHGSVAEDHTSNETYSAYVGRVNATDNDGTSPNNQFNYFISSGADEKFSINSISGEVNVQINAKLDRETKPNYTLTILIIDHGASPKSASATMEIKIEDVNDEKPRFVESLCNANITENSAFGTSVVKCSAKDDDLDSFLHYDVIGVSGRDENGNEVNKTEFENYFGINNGTGEILVKGDIDRETVKVIELTLMVIDINASSATKPQNDTATVRIEILDENDNYPEFMDEHVTLNVSENSQIPTILHTIETTDDDENRTIYYNISAVFKTDSSVNPFTIDQAGVLRLSNTIDREVDDVIIVTIEATDSGITPLSSYNNVTINVIDVNDNPPIFNRSSYNDTYYVPENTTGGTVIFNITATDIDKGPNAIITYSIDNGDKGNFTVDPLQGSISVKNSLDREHLSSYVLTITAKDNPTDTSEQKTTSVSVTIVITDINDNQPEFSQNEYMVAKREDTPVGETLIMVTATDKDEPSSNNSKLSFEIETMNTTEPLFKINADTGSIMVNMSLRDRVGIYQLNVSAFDWGIPSLQNTVPVLITVEDVNLHDPVITNIPSNNTIKIYECVRTGTIIHSFNHTDADRGKNAEAFYNISSVDATTSTLITDTFNISESGELYTLQKLSVKRHRFYKMQVQAIDRGDPVRKSDKVTITIDVLDVNDHPPQFPVAVAKYTLKENQNDTFFGSVTAIDEDSNAIKCYNISEPNAHNFFTVGLHNGSLSNTQMLDYEATHSYSFTVKVHDCSVELNISQVCENITIRHYDNDTLKVSVTIEDVNDNPPVFNQKSMFTGMVRRTEVNTTLEFKLKSYIFVSDQDSKRNGINAWVFQNDGEVIPSPRLADTGSGQDACADGHRHVFCISPNGSIINNKYFKEDVSGYFVVPVMVSDTAGSDIANITIYLIADSQILVMTVLDPKERVAAIRDELLQAYGDIVGFDLVYDKIEDHKSTSGVIFSDQSDLHFHIVDRQTKEVLSGSEATRILDTFSAKLTSTMKKYHVTTVDIMTCFHLTNESILDRLHQSVQMSSKEDKSSKTQFILIAVIVALVVSNAIFIYVFLHIKQRYKRKLLAATITTQDKGIEMQTTSMAVPGSNKYMSQSNPLLNAEFDEHQGPQYDEISLNSNNSLDSNDVDYRSAEPSDYDRIEEKEVTLDMYTEDTFTASVEGESPLEAALRIHEKNKEERASREMEQDIGDDFDEVEEKQAYVFQNDAYYGNDEQLESSEI